MINKQDWFNFIKVQKLKKIFISVKCEMNINSTKSG